MVRTQRTCGDKNVESETKLVNFGFRSETAKGGARNVELGRAVLFVRVKLSGQQKWDLFFDAAHDHRE